MLSFHPRHDVRCIVRNLVENMGKFSDWSNPVYYNIETFRLLDSGNGASSKMALASSVA